MSTPNVQEQAVGFANLPPEIVEIIIRFYMEHQILPIARFTFWDPSEPLPDRDRLPKFNEEEVYAETVPPTQSGGRQLKWSWDSAFHQFAAALVSPPAHRPNDHAFGRAFPSVGAAYRRLVLMNTLIQVDLDSATLRDPASWDQIFAPEPLPNHARHLYIRLASAENMRDESEQTFADMRSLLEFIKRFPNIEILSVDVVHRDKPCEDRPTHDHIKEFCEHCPTTLLQHLLAIDKTYFSRLQRMWILRQKFRWQEADERFKYDGNFFPPGRPGGTRWMWWMEQQRKLHVHKVKMATEARRKRQPEAEGSRK